MPIAIETNHGGHYGLNMMDPGAVNGSYKEAVIAQTLNSKVLKIVGGHDASDFSATNVNQNLVNQVANMNRYAKVNGWNLSHHLNAFNRQANGVEVWYYAGDEAARQKAGEVSAAIARALGLVNRGAKPTTNLYVVSNSNGHTLLIEWCFIDNVNDIASLLNNMDKAVAAMVNCFGYGSPTPNPEPSKPVPPSIDQGPGITVNKWIQITDRKYVTYNSFGFDQMLTGKQLFGMRFNVRTEYKHKNGATYYSLFSEHGEWFGYINANATKAAQSPQGPGIAVNYVGTIDKKGWSIYSGFDWKEIMKSDVIYDKPVRIKTEYNHENGSKYLSLYDGNEKWLGYVNADVLKK